MAVIAQRNALRLCVALAAAVPIAGGLWGAIESIGGVSAWSTDHYRYLSGLLCGIGIGFVSTIPRIETHGQRFTLLTGIVVVGGLGRLLSLIATGAPSTAMKAALAMELVVTPTLALWQRGVARRAA